MCLWMLLSSTMPIRSRRRISLAIQTLACAGVHRVGKPRASSVHRQYALTPSGAAQQRASHGEHRRIQCRSCRRHPTAALDHPCAGGGCNGNCTAVSPIQRRSAAPPPGKKRRSPRFPTLPRVLGLTARLLSREPRGYVKASSAVERINQPQRVEISHHVVASESKHDLTHAVIGSCLEELVKEFEREIAREYSGHLQFRSNYRTGRVIQKLAGKSVIQKGAGTSSFTGVYEDNGSSGQRLTFVKPCVNIDGRDSFTNLGALSREGLARSVFARDSGRF